MSVANVPLACFSRFHPSNKARGGEITGGC